MVEVHKELCRKCGVCIKKYNGFCLIDNNGMPEIDRAICNQCQKCVAICPFQAISVNGKPPIKIEKPFTIDRTDLLELYRRRRSCKSFRNEGIPKEVLKELALAAKYAPNQNKNIGIVIIDSRELLDEIEAAASKYVRRIYRLLSLIRFLKVFSKSLAIMLRKMEFGINVRKHVVYENTQAFLFTVGNPHIPVTEASAHYMLSFMLLYAEALGIGNCLMDAIMLSVNSSRKLRKRLGIRKGEKVLGTLALGYSGENIVNVPEGYEVDTLWNGVRGWEAV